VSSVLCSSGTYVHDQHGQWPPPPNKTQHTLNFAAAEIRLSFDLLSAKCLRKPAALQDVGLQTKLL
jgi:hypothetical protein